MNEQVIAELELLAKWRWYIEGNGFDPTKEKAHREPSAGRPEIVDEKHEEVALAMKARATLELLRASSPRGKKFAALLQKHFVEQGSAARRVVEPPQRLTLLERELWRRTHEKRLQHALNAYQKCFMASTSE